MRVFVVALLQLLALTAAPLRAIAQAELPPSRPQASPRALRIKADLRDILTSRDYRLDKPREGVLSRIGKWISKKWDAFVEWLRRVFSFGGRLGGGSAPVLPYILTVALILLMAYAIAYAIKNYKGGSLATKKTPTVDTLLEPEEAAAAEPDAWISAAKRHAAAGDYRRAYRAVFIAILIRLDRAGALRFERSKTNGDYVRALGDKPKLLAFLRPLANDFDARWYGHVSSTEADFRKVLANYNEVPDAPS